jgi:transketolase
MRKAALEAISRLVEVDDRVVFVGSDLGAGTMSESRNLNPDRVFMEGIAEQHIVSFAAGLAIEGFVPFVHTIATFLTRRAFEQIAIDVALDRLPVVFLGSGGGMVYSPLGPTHQAIDDFSLMRSVPGMLVVAPADPLEMATILAMLAATPGPAYVRVGKGGEPVVTSNLSELSFGKAREIRHGNNLAVITTGALLHECITAADQLEAQGTNITVFHFPFIEPLDREVVLSLSTLHSNLLVVEEHIPQGGLSSAITDLLGEISPSTRVHRLTLPNSYATKYGTQQDHWRFHGLDSHGIRSKISDILLSHSLLDIGEK